MAKTLFLLILSEMIREKLHNFTDFQYSGNDKYNLSCLI